MIDDTLTRSEKAALVLSMMGQILSIFTWYVGHDADLSGALPILKVGFGIAGAIALDLVVVTTTMGRRAGRRSWWGALTILAAAVFSAAIALDAAGGPTLGAWNHISYPVVIVLFAQHLAAPKKTQTAPATVNPDEWLIEPGSLQHYPQGVCKPIDEQPSITTIAPAQLPAPAVDDVIDIIRWKEIDKLSFSAIGVKLGCTRQAAQQRYAKAKKG